MLDNSADIRPNQIVDVTIPPGFLVAGVTYGTGANSHRAVFLAFDTGRRVWLVGEWDANREREFYRRTEERFEAVNVYGVEPAQFGAACMDFVRRSNPLLKEYAA